MFAVLGVSLPTLSPWPVAEPPSSGLQLSVGGVGRGKMPAHWQNSCLKCMHFVKYVYLKLFNFFQKIFVYGAFFLGFGKENLEIIS